MYNIEPFTLNFQMLLVKRYDDKTYLNVDSFSNAITTQYFE